MKWVQRIVFGVLIGSFPIAMYLFATNRNKVAKVEVATQIEKSDGKLIEHAVNGKIREIADIDVKVLETEAELIRFKELKQSVIKDLEQLRDRITPIIEQSKGLAKNAADNKATE